MTIFAILMCYLVKKKSKETSIKVLYTFQASVSQKTKFWLFFFLILLNIHFFSFAVTNDLNVSNLTHFSLMFVMLALCSN